MTMTDLAKQLDGRQYGSEIEPSEIKQAKANMLLVVFGYSDDNVEFRGVFEDEIGAYDADKKEIFFTIKGLLEGQDSHDECECAYCGFKEAKKNALSITASFTTEGWKFDTKLPHSKFKVMEDGEQYGEGLVIALAINLHETT